jgi:hypothetical protein
VWEVGGDRGTEGDLDMDKDIGWDIVMNKDVT